MFLTRGSDAMFRVNKCESGIMHRPDSRRYDTVQQRLTELTAALEQAATTLRGGYQAEQLYALRVSMRRLRSMLKPLSSSRSRQFRKTWGGFATVTNQARDWDVFLLAARDLLPEEQYGAFEARNRQNVLFCHEAVIELIESAPWQRHLQEWHLYLERPHHHEAEEFMAPRSLDLALSGARTALAAARASGDERAWHKLRIAVKEVRYQAESGPGGTAEDPVQAELIEHCKPLQALLGSWHDCVVQLQLLEELETTPDHDHLRGVIEQKRVQGLAEIQQAVEDHPLFEPSSSTTRARSASLNGS